ncbi:MAG: DegT/DnrJ/EryC1/StrS family aminotransferase [Candidatus Obscuribacterales bacterium]|nr:DegT/DnrJ/EryC1/StrS family aminotransferase [Candidatus Obscuribacterales bacterium]
MSFKVPFGDVKLRYESLRKQIEESVQRVLPSGYYILGPELERFEKRFADFLGADFSVGCASGTEAIYLAMKAAGVGPGDEVIVVAHTAVPTISAISMTGAEPVFVDIDPSTYVMDATKVEAAITAKTKAIIPVHIYGQVVDLDPLLALGRARGIPVIEDVAQATGATYKGKIAGTMGDFGAFSFYPSKNLGAFGDGGAVCTNSEEGYRKLLMLRNYGQSKRYHHDEIGINSRLDELQAAILDAQLPYVHEWNVRRREIARRFTAGLKDVVVTPAESSFGTHVYHLYVIQTQDRDALQQYLLDKGIQTLIHYPIPAHLQKAYAYRGYKRGDLPVTEQVTQRILSLPMFPELTDSQVDFVIQEIVKYHALNPQHVFVPTPGITTPLAK